MVLGCGDLPMGMMIGKGLWYVINHPESTKDALLTALT
jgi:hypothetical protein